MTRLAALLLAGALGRPPADDPPAKDPTGDDPTGDDPTADDPTARANALSFAAEDAFADGDFAEASDLLRRAYALDPRPAYLLGRAQAERRADRCKEALELYRAYLDLGATTEQAEFVRGHMQECQRRIAEKGAPAPAEPTASEPDGGSPPIAASPSAGAAAPATDSPKGLSRRQKVGAGLLGTGGGALVIGGGLYVGAAVAVRSAGDAGDEARVERLVRRSRALEGAAVGVLVVGAAMVIAGAIVFAVRHRRGDGRAHRTRHHRAHALARPTRFAPGQALARPTRFRRASR